VVCNHHRALRYVLEHQTEQVFIPRLDVLKLLSVLHQHSHRNVRSGSIVRYLHSYVCLWIHHMDEDGKKQKRREIKKNSYLKNSKRHMARK